MTARIDKQVARCFGLLRSQELSPLVEYFRAVRADTLEHLTVAADDKAVARLQGKAQFLKDLISNVEEADALISKLKHQ